MKPNEARKILNRFVEGETPALDQVRLAVRVATAANDRELGVVALGALAIARDAHVYDDRPVRIAQAIDELPGPSIDADRGLS